MINNMEQNFNFEKIGKQMPYTVPEGFFNKLEENVMKKVESEDVKAEPKRRAKIIRMAIRAAIAAAACLALFFIVQKSLPQDEPVKDEFNSVELAFNNLSTEDQDYLLEVYQDDLFMDNESY